MSPTPTRHRRRRSFKSGSKQPQVAASSQNNHNKSASSSYVSVLEYSLNDQYELCCAIKQILVNGDDPQYKGKEGVDCRVVDLSRSFL